MVRQGLEHALQIFGPYHRLVMGVDSLVSCGVANEGRSASRALNREWRKAVGLQVLAGMRLGVHYAPTQYNPADHPSRGKCIPPPTSALPPWWTDEELPAALDLYGQQCFTRIEAMWVDIVARLRRRSALQRGRCGATASPLAACDPTSLEGDGPAAAPRRRDGIDLRAMSMVTRPVASRRKVLLKRLHVWLEHRKLSLTVLWINRVELADTLLADYGQHCFENKGSLHDFAETLNAVVAGRPEWRRATAKAWRVAHAWRSLVPVKSHRPMPLPILLAMQAVAMRRCEFRMCAALGLGFLGLLRPAEVLKLKGKCLLKPLKLMGPPHLMYIDIGAAKSSSRGGALHQHVRVEDAIFVPFMEKISGQLGPEELVWSLGSYAFRLLWDSLLSELGVPVGQQAGLTPASLRAGGATHMFAMTQDVQLVRWRGRWQSVTTLEHYLQEVGSASIVPNLAPVAREAVCRWAAQARVEVSRFAAAP